MKKTAIVIFTYALLVFLGGMIGYFYSGSSASLISASVFGTLLLFSAILCFKKKPIGYPSAFALSLILEVVFIWRFVKTQNFMPAGFLGFISLIVLIIIALKIRKPKTA